jgi:hypothetical protein
MERLESHLLQARPRLRERGIEFIQRDRGFADSITPQDPNGLGHRSRATSRTRDFARGASTAHRLGGTRRLSHADEHLADAIQILLDSRKRCRSKNAEPRNQKRQNLEPDSSAAPHFLQSFFCDEVHIATLADIPEADFRDT